MLQYPKGSAEAAAYKQKVKEDRLAPPSPPRDSTPEQVSEAEASRRLAIRIGRRPPGKAFPSSTQCPS